MVDVDIIASVSVDVAVEIDVDTVDTTDAVMAAADAVDSGLAIVNVKMSNGVLW